VSRPAGAPPTQGEGAVRAEGLLRPAAALAARPAPRRPDFRQLHKKLETTLANIQQSEEIHATLQEILDTLVRDFGQDLGLLGGRLYQKQGKKYVLLAQSGRGRRARRGFSVPTSYRPLERLAQQGYVFSRKGDPDFDPRIEGPLGIRAYAAIGIGERNRYLISFNLRRRFAEEQIIYALNTVRHVVNMKIQQERLEDILWEAREIQMSMLPREVPRFKGYELYGRSLPAEVVGGDLFDYIPITGRVMGVAVADARGHGLPASLQARDVVVGLRMGAEMHFKMVTTIEKLNRVIARSALAAQFVSLFYGELEHNGNLIYCNAGHHPGLLLRGERIIELTKGGLLLGPNPDAHYERGFVVLRKGDLLLLYTDGVVEAVSPRGEEFGAERLRAMMVEGRELPARELTQQILSRVEQWCHPARPKDDRTVMVIRRTD
jgi:sigma-B regulation protein RsbU (phosphoserine phosphatase)